MILSRTPFRISFFGGGADYPAWYRRYGGKVLGTAIDKYCYISVRHLPPFFDYKHRIVWSKVEHVKDFESIQHPAVRGVLQEMGGGPGLEIHHDGDLPARSGLGSSSAFTVGFIHALKALDGKMIPKRDLASRAIHMEQEILKENVGSQDQVLTAMGGFNLVEFQKDDTFDITPIIFSKDKTAHLQHHMMLFFTGFTRVASDIARSCIENLEKRRDEINRMQEMVEEAVCILQDDEEPAKRFGNLLHEYWLCKKSWSGKISKPEIDEIYETAMRAGAYGGKLLGAGGGGFLLIMIRPELKQKLCEKLRKLTCVNFRFDFTGSKIVVYEPNDFQ